MREAFVTVDRQDLFRRYALALALVPDEDVAGDLFMNAQGDDDLLRRANRWRKQAGLDPADLPWQLPALSSHQEEHALHLAARAKRRGQTRLTLIAGVGLLGLALLVVLAFRGAAPNGLAADAAFAGRPLESAQLSDELKLSVYRAEAGASEVTVWWEIIGPNAAELGKELRPAAKVAEARLFVSPQKTEVTATRRDRLLGKSTYRMLVTSGEIVTLRADGFGAAKTAVTIAADLTVKEKLVALPVNLQVRIGGGLITVEEIAITPENTRIRYSVTGLQVPAYLDAVSTEAGTLRPALGVQVVGSKLEAVLPPLRPGTTDLTLQFEQGYEAATDLSFDLGRPGGPVTVEREGQRMLMRVRVSNGVVIGPGAGVIDRQGNRYLAQVLRGAGADQLTLSVVATVPPEAEPYRLVIPTMTRKPGAHLNVNLLPFLSR